MTVYGVPIPKPKENLEKLSTAINADVHRLMEDLKTKHGLTFKQIIEFGIKLAADHLTKEQK